MRCAGDLEGVGACDRAPSSPPLSLSLSQQNITINKCTDRAGENIPYWDGELFGQQVLPFVDMTVAGFIWYQGENNMGAPKARFLPARTRHPHPQLPQHPHPLPSACMRAAGAPSARSPVPPRAPLLTPSPPPPPPPHPFAILPPSHRQGNAAANVGYGCEMVQLIEGWRATWSQTPNTTSPLAPFGVVTLASSGRCAPSII
jgi:hypothetical protein